MAGRSITAGDRTGTDRMGIAARADRMAAGKAASSGTGRELHRLRQGSRERLRLRRQDRATRSSGLTAL
jgi:hypothetical protein